MPSNMRVNRAWDPRSLRQTQADSERVPPAVCERLVAGEKARPTFVRSFQRNIDGQ
jgi:hypothetical protein